MGAADNDKIEVYMSACSTPVGYRSTEELVLVMDEVGKAAVAAAAAADDVGACVGVDAAASGVGASADASAACAGTGGDELVVATVTVC